MIIIISIIVEVAMTKKKFIFYLPFIIITFAIILRLILPYFQYATIYTPNDASLDDQLMIDAAKSIVEGQWLGEYDNLTMAKHMGFAIWLAFVHVLGIPILVANAAFYALSCAIATIAVFPIVKNIKFRVLLFLILLYNPASFAEFTTRIYRDGIFPALVLICVSSAVGIALRKGKKCIPWLVFCGLSTGSAVLTREDGFYVLIFVIPAIILACIFSRCTIKQWAQRILIPAAFTLALIFVYCNLNYIHYGIFTISDFSMGSFSTAYGAMTSVKNGSINTGNIPLSNKTISEIAKHSKTFNTIYDELYDKHIQIGLITDDKEFNGGSIYWGIRRAAQEAGYYKDAITAEQFFSDVESEILTAIENGDLKIDKLNQTTTASLKPQQIPSVINTAVDCFFAVMNFYDCNPVPLMTNGPLEEKADTIEFVNQNAVHAYIENSTEIYFPFTHVVSIFIMKSISLIYPFILYATLACSIWFLIKQAKYFTLKTAISNKSMFWFALIGIILLCILRLFMIAFVEVTSFSIGIQAMYLSSIHPLFLFGFTCSTMLLFEKNDN